MLVCTNLTQEVFQPNAGALSLWMLTIKPDRDLSDIKLLFCQIHMKRANAILVSYLRWSFDRDVHCLQMDNIWVDCLLYPHWFAFKHFYLCFASYFGFHRLISIPIIIAFHSYLTDLFFQISCLFVRRNEIGCRLSCSLYLAHLQLNPLSRKSASPEERSLKPLWDYLSACAQMLSFRRHGAVDCNGVIVLMPLLTSELLTFNTSLLYRQTLQNKLILINTGFSTEIHILLKMHLELQFESSVSKLHSFVPVLKVRCYICTIFKW